MADLVGNIGGPKGDKGDRGDPTTINQGDGISVTGPATTRTVAARPSADDGNAFGFGTDGGGFVKDLGPDLQGLADQIAADLAIFLPADEKIITSNRNLVADDFGKVITGSSSQTVLTLVGNVIASVPVGATIVIVAPAGAGRIRLQRTAGDAWIRVVGPNITGTNTVLDIDPGGWVQVWKNPDNNGRTLRGIASGNVSPALV